MHIFCSFHYFNLQRNMVYFVLFYSLRPLAHHYLRSIVHSAQHDVLHGSDWQNNDDQIRIARIFIRLNMIFHFSIGFYLLKSEYKIVQIEKCSEYVKMNNWSVNMIEFYGILHVLVWEKGWTVEREKWIADFK